LKIAYISLGCPKNEIDLEIILGRLGEQIDIVDDPRSAQATIINTCAFITSAREESIQTILELISLKEKNPAYKILVTGCLPQRYHHLLEKEIPEVNAFFDVLEPIRAAGDIGKFLQVSLADPSPRRRITPKHYAYLRIADGCDNRCSYCAIPVIKGPYRSRAFTDVLDEARSLVDSGARELILVAQDTTNYGNDLVPRRTLGELILALEEIDRLKWIRLMYTHPARWDDQLIDTIAHATKVVRYVDLPVQHASDRILESMRRRVTQADLRSLIRKLRDRIPGIRLRTSLIVGYPGETRKEYRKLVDFVREVEFDRLGVFTYSHEEDTRAYALSDNVSHKTKIARQENLLAIQAEISYHKNQQLVGKTVEAVVDEIDKENNTSIARTSWDAPEIDNMVLIPAMHRIGTFLKVRITKAETFDLWGKVVSAAEGNSAPREEDLP
jgi:ribosomal protein S12 methylthiotransferase